MNTNYIYGIRSIIEAIDAGKEVERIFLQQGLSNPLMNELKMLLKQHEVIYQAVPVEKLNRITNKNHQGAVCFLSEVQYQKLYDVLPMIYEKSETPFILLLDRLTDVRNIGAIARTAVCAGVHAIVVPSRGSGQLNADAMKASAGALNKIMICREHDLKKSIVFMRESGLQIIGCTEKTSSLIYDADYKNPTAIIMGSEEDGISPEYLKLCDLKVKIPMTEEIGSLNVSVAAGVVIYEAVRQRRN